MLNLEFILPRPNDDTILVQYDAIDLQSDNCTSPHTTFKLWHFPTTEQDLVKLFAGIVHHKIINDSY